MRFIESYPTFSASKKACLSLAHSFVRFFLFVISIHCKCEAPSLSPLATAVPTAGVIERSSNGMCAQMNMGKIEATH